MAAADERNGALQALERAENLVTANTPATLSKRLAVQREAYLASRLDRA